MTREQPNAESDITRIVDRNIRAMLERRRQDDLARSTQERIADRITAFAGSMVFIYLHAAIFGLWIVINLAVPSWAFDRTFVGLAMVASVGAFFLSSFLLITQNRMAAAADKRADLDLHISLLAEHEITRLIALTAK